MILQTRLPYDIHNPRRLPGIAPLGDGPWLVVDEAFAEQMAERARLIAERPDDVIFADPSAAPALSELFETVLAHLPEGFVRKADVVTRPDGMAVPLDPSAPLHTLGHLVQEDLCLMEKRGDEHVLTAAVVCFPAGWRLAEKAMRPLTAIHDPVPDYDSDMARRVQRLFDGVRDGQPLWRFNAHWYDDPALYQSRAEHRLHRSRDPERAGFLRSERQCVLRLPRTRAAVFSIHTYVLARASAMAQSAAPVRS